MGGDADYHRDSLQHNYFNSRPRVGGDGRNGQTITLDDLFQFTPPRGGRRSDNAPDDFALRISIHAPAWGATLWLLQTLINTFISIHAPAWGATRRGQRQSLYSANFNSRPRVGGDVQCIRKGRVGRDISIHAPAWGATKFQAMHTTSDSFQFTPPRGGRRMLSSTTACEKLFQFTPPRGGATKCGQRRGQRIEDFNSRPRVGGDPPELVRGMMNFVFQFTPPRGGRRAESEGQRMIEKFQFTPPRGGRPGGMASLELTVISIHAPAWGATADAGRTAGSPAIFQFTPPRGGRRR